MDYLFVCCTHVKQKPYLKAPDDDLDPGTAANIVWEIHRKGNGSVMVELFDVRLPVLIFNTGIKILISNKKGAY